MRNKKQFGLIGRDIEYSLVEINGVNENSLAKINDKIVVASELLEQTLKELSVSNYNISTTHATNLLGVMKI